MVNPRVVLNDEDITPVADKLHGPLEEQLTSALQAAADDVESHYHGEDVDETADELLEHAKDALHPDIAAGFHPDPAELRDVAEAIVTEKTT
ncbi:MAG TPA: hypothetical protein VGJ28_05285 [Micromonosporaceae bacterium]|jgi:hypothetical protein